MASGVRRATNFSEGEHLLLAELGTECPEIESNRYNNKSLHKKTRAWQEILSKFDTQNSSGIWRDLTQLQGCWKRLKSIPKNSTMNNAVNREELLGKNLLP